MRTVFRNAGDRRRKTFIRKIGPFSRGGTSRGQQATRAADHDMHVEAFLIPVGILEVDTDQLNILFGTSRETSDFVADALEQWWVARMAVHPHVRRLLIDLDNGPNVASSRELAEEWAILTANRT